MLQFIEFCKPVFWIPTSKKSIINGDLLTIDRSKCGYYDRMSVMQSVMHDEGDTDDTNDRPLCSL